MYSLPGIAMAQGLTEADENKDAKVFRKMKSGGNWSFRSEMKWQVWRKKKDY